MNLQDSVLLKCKHANYIVKSYLIMHCMLCVLSLLTKIMLWWVSRSLELRTVKKMGFTLPYAGVK